MKSETDHLAQQKMCSASWASLLTDGREIIRRQTTVNMRLLLPSRCWWFCQTLLEATEYDRQHRYDTPNGSLYCYFVLMAVYMWSLRNIFCMQNGVVLHRKKLLLYREKCPLIEKLRKKKNTKPGCIFRAHLSAGWSFDVCQLSTYNTFRSVSMQYSSEYCYTISFDRFWMT